MGYVAGCDWDIFISYARLDDRPLREGEKGWVSSFVHALKVAVANFMGEEIKFFFDLEDAGPGFEDLEFIKRCAANSALMVSVVSPTYCRRPWTLEELKVFCERWPDNSRLIALERLPIGPEDMPPLPIEQKNRARFWRDLPNPNIKGPLPPSSERFDDVLLDFAHGLKVHLRALRREAEEAQRRKGKRKPKPKRETGGEMLANQPPKGDRESEPPDPIQLPAPGPVRTVLIAQGTDDVADSIEGIRRYLGQFPEAVRILPEGDYPQGGKDFERAFGEDLEQADIVVQLLGARAGRAPPDLPSGYTRFQLEAARRADKNVLQWRHPELDVEAVADEAYRAILNDPRVAVSGMEEFKARILSEARRENVGTILIDPATVFINADRDNALTAADIGDEFERENYVPAYPKFDGSSSENRKYLNKMMAECGVLVLVHGCPRPTWVATQKRLFDYVRLQRKADPEGLVVCTVPPGDSVGPDLIGNEFEQIDCSAGFDPESVRNYIAGLKGRAEPPQPQPEA